MSVYKIEIKTKSNALVGSGTGFGANIDADVMLDDLGIPYIPSKRVKGSLRDSAREVAEMFQKANIRFPIASDFLFSSPGKKYPAVLESIFGNPGEKESAPVYFQDLHVSSQDREWIGYWQDIKAISKIAVIEAFTELRQQTKIDEETGAAADHSLRTIRVLKQGLVFSGEIQTKACSQGMSIVLALACQNLKYMGTKRNRGFGHVECKLYSDSGEELTTNVLRRLEPVCKE